MKLLRMFDLIDESLLFRSGLNLCIMILSESFNEVLSVMWPILKLPIYISIYIMTCFKNMVRNTAVGRSCKKLTIYSHAMQTPIEYPSDPVNLS